MRCGLADWRGDLCELRNDVMIVLSQLRVVPYDLARQRGQLCAVRCALFCWRYSSRWRGGRSGATLLPRARRSTEIQNLPYHLRRLSVSHHVELPLVDERRGLEVHEDAPPWKATRQVVHQREALRHVSRSPAGRRQGWRRPTLGRACSIRRFLAEEDDIRTQSRIAAGTAKRGIAGVPDVLHVRPTEAAQARDEAMEVYDVRAARAFQQVVDVLREVHDAGQATRQRCQRPMRLVRLGDFDGRTPGDRTGRG